MFAGSVILHLFSNARSGIVRRGDVRCVVWLYHGQARSTCVRASELGGGLSVLGTLGLEPESRRAGKSKIKGCKGKPPFVSLCVFISL